jgi:hypothetical protein
MSSRRPRPILVEFVNPADGSTRALAELTTDQLVPAGG